LRATCLALLDWIEIVVFWSLTGPNEATDSGFCLLGLGFHLGGFIDRLLTVELGGLTT
jgi:hypothetical protein